MPPDIGAHRSTSACALRLPKGTECIEAARGCCSSYIEQRLLPAWLAWLQAGELTEVQLLLRSIPELREDDSSLTEMKQLFKVRGAEEARAVGWDGQGSGRGMENVSVSTREALCVCQCSRLPLPSTYMVI